MQEERKAPLPGRIPAQAQAAIGSAGMAGARASSKNLQDMQEERKQTRANMGAQVIAGNRNTARGGQYGGAQQATKKGPSNEFANAPQYTKGGHNL